MIGSKVLSTKKRKSLKIKYSGRSTDFIPPSFGHGCLFKCSYCYMRRYNPEGLTIYSNADEILQAIDNHARTLGPKQKNQCHPTHWNYDIGVNEDFALHLKYHDWRKIFDYFKHSPTAAASFATKYVNEGLLRYNPNKKIRIRFSLMPQEWSNILEPNTSKIKDRILAVDRFQEAGYEVHLNFSPVIAHKDTKKLYTQLFEQVDDLITNKQEVKSEVILLTHSIKLHDYNILHSPEAEELLWSPQYQERKVTSYGSEALRYEYQRKERFIRKFEELYRGIIPWCKIRYIF